MNGRLSGGRRMGRRDFIKLSAAGLAGTTLLGVVGCGGGERQGSGGASNNLIVAEGFEPSVLNPFITGGDSAATADVVARILEQPFQLMPDLTYSPKLADGDARMASQDPQVIELRLKDGLKWSDGEPLTSADAKWTYEQIMDPKNKIVTRTGWDKIEKFEAPDERTLRMTFKEPYAPWHDLWGIITFTWLTTGDPQITTLFGANQLPPKGQNVIRYRNETVTKDLEESDTTLDVTKRAQLLKSAQEQMAEDCPILPLYQRPDIYAFSDNLRGPEVDPSLAGPYWNIGEWSLSG